MELGQNGLAFFCNDSVEFWYNLFNILVENSHAFLYIYLLNRG